MELDHDDKKNKIIAIIEELYLERGGEVIPTNKEVRERLGEGSFSLIAPILKEWRDTKKDLVNNTIELPAKLKKSIDPFLLNLWKVASSLAQEEIVKLQADHEIKINNLHNDWLESLEETSKLEGKLQESKLNEDSQKIEIERLISEKTILQEKLSLTNKNYEILAEAVKQKNLLISELQKDKEENSKRISALLEAMTSKKKG